METHRDGAFGSPVVGWPLSPAIALGDITRPEQRGPKQPEHVSASLGSCSPGNSAGATRSRNDRHEARSGHTLVTDSADSGFPPLRDQKSVSYRPRTFVSIEGSPQNAPAAKKRFSEAKNPRLGLSQDRKLWPNWPPARQSLWSGHPDLRYCM